VLACLRLVQTELVEDPGDVPLDGRNGDDEPLGDPAVRTPSAMSASTSRSRGVSEVSGLSIRLRPTNRAMTSGSSAERPSATRRTASIRTSGLATFSFSR